MDLITTLRIAVRSTDMDADQVVNNARYFEYFEQVRLQHMRALGIIGEVRPPGAARRSFTIAETTCRYLAAVRYPEVLAGEAWTAKVGTRSFAFAYRLARESDGVAVAEGGSAQVWLDTEGRAAPLPEDVRASLERSLRGE